MDDVDQHARIGLYTASQKYDPDGLHRGRAFRTVATFAIQKEIRRALHLDAIEDQPTQPNITILPISPVEPPSWLIEDRYQTRELAALGPSVEEQVVAVVDGAQVSATLEAALLLLTPKQRTIIERRYGLTADGAIWTQREVGQLLGVTQQSVSKTQRKALAILRAHLGETRDGQLLLIDLEEKRQQRRPRKRATAA